MDVRRFVRFPALVVLPSAVLALTAGQCNGAPNQPPVASIGEDRTVAVGELVTLDGGGSSDPDGDPLSFVWELDQMPDGSAATLSDADTPAPSFTADVAGRYVATLTVSDGNLEASDSVSVAARQAPNDAPSLSSIDDQRTPMNEPIEVPFTLQDEDPDGVTFEASSSDATLVAEGDIEVLGGGAERSLRITPAPMGLGGVTITLVAQDQDGLEDSISFALSVTRPFSAQFPKLTAVDAAAGDQFGGSVAISGDFALVGAYLDVDDGASSGSAYVFQRSGDAWNQIDKLTASDAAAGDRFGSSVAIDGDYALIGAFGNDDDGTSSGSAYVFQRSGDAWSQTSVLTANDAGTGDYFGYSVAMNDDYALIGAFGNDDDGTNSGSAYVFQRSGDAWNQIAKLTANDAAQYDEFGSSVAIDGDHALVGAIRDDDDGTGSGSAYVFQRSGDAWSQTEKLTAHDAAEGDRFGGSVATSGDYALIGAVRDDDDGTDSGSAYVFQRGGDAWSQTHKLTAHDAAAGDWFARSVAIDGDHALIGATRDDGTDSGSGSAYVYLK